MAENPAPSENPPIVVSPGVHPGTERHTGARLAKALAIAAVAPLFLLPLCDALDLPALRLPVSILALAAPLSAVLAWRARGDFAAAPNRFRNTADADLGYRVGFALTALWIAVFVGAAFLLRRPPDLEAARGEAERDRGQAAMCSAGVARIGTIALAPSTATGPAQKSAELAAYLPRIAEARAACERAGRDEEAHRLDGEERRVRAQISRLQAAEDEPL